MTENIPFSTLNVKNFNFKNRIGFAPITRMSSSGGGIPRQDAFDLLIRRAQNGAGIVYPEGVVTDYESAQGYPNATRMVTQPQIEAWRPVVKAIQKEGAIAIMQMFHTGRIGWPEVNPAKRIIAPSPIAPKGVNPINGMPYPIPDVISNFDINHVITGFVETAKGAMEAGFDGVEVHGAHGYLINQFLSSYSNKRKDDYGGSVSNRFRFAHEVIQAVRTVIPDNRLLTFRISNFGVADMEISLFESKAEYQEIISMLSDEPIDLVSISTYSYKEKAFRTEQNMAQITREVTDLPIMICGQIYNQSSAYDALQDADIILSGKSMLLNPNWVEDVRSGKELPLYCSEDADIAFTDQPLP